MMARKPVHEAVLDHPRGAIGALKPVPAMAAKGQRRETPAIEKEQGLFTAIEIGFELTDELWRKPAAA